MPHRLLARAGGGGHCDGSILLSVVLKKAVSSQLVWLDHDNDRSSVISFAESQLLRPFCRLVSNFDESAD